MERKLLTIEEVAFQLDVSVSTVRRWVRSGKLVGQKAGAQWRFDRNAVRDAWEQGRLSAAAPSALGVTPCPEPPEWAKPLVAKWRAFLEELLRQEQPDHVIVNDRRGAKIWALIRPDGYSWGHDLWHSTAVRLMEEQQVRSLFGRAKVLLFDEMIQHGREMHELRQRLEGRAIGARVTSATCVRGRSQVESGKLLEYQARACEDLDDELFAERAATISRLVHGFEPPLDVDHLIVKGSLLPGFKEEELLERLARWGIPFVVWVPDKEHRFLAVTLDRPQFFNTANSLERDGFRFAWDGPCKIRFYVSPQSGECYCSFIVYPEVEASLSAWEKRKAAASNRTAAPSAEELNYAYFSICADLGLNLVNDFLVSGACEEIGIRLPSSFSPAEIGQLRATFGQTLGDRIAGRLKTILAGAAGGKGLFSLAAGSPPPLLIREVSEVQNNCDAFECRIDVVKAIPQRLSEESGGEPRRPISYGDLVRQLPQYSQSTISRVFDHELDRGTVKPTTDPVDHAAQDGVGTIRVRRAYWRGEFGAWFEWDRRVVTHDDVVIQRTFGLGPTVVEAYLRRANAAFMRSTQFNKVFANLQHDLRQNVHDLFYLTWRPYKYGPVPVVPRVLASGSYMEFQRLLVERQCLTVTPERHGTRTWHTYRPAADDVVAWRKVYRSRVSPVTQAHLSGLLRLYAAISKECTTVRRAPGSLSSSEFQDPLVVLAAARNQEVAYTCAWFEVADWTAQGVLLFPFLSSVALGGYCQTPALKPYLEAFAAPARLLFDKIEMYRNLPHLRGQIQELLSRRDDLDAGVVLLETVDSEPKFESHSDYPMRNLEWACSIMRAFSSMTRQVLTACKLDVYKEGPQDASVYLQRLLDNCPQLQVLEDRLQSCIGESRKGVLTEEIAESLSTAFRLILMVLDAESCIPDPRPQYEQRRERQQSRDGLLVALREIPHQPPYFIAVADIYNVRNLPKLAELFGMPYEQALENVLNRVWQSARSVAGRCSGLVLGGGLIGDNVLLAGLTPDVVLEAAIAFLKETTTEAILADRRLERFSLMRVGIALRDDGLGSGFECIRSGLAAYELADSRGREPGTLAVTGAVYERLSPQYQALFTQSADEPKTQGGAFVAPPANFR